ncbi:MAG: pyruvate kinase [Pseudolabrys sp.]|nr:pyruvate kinase [Pseudolabrys sp.]
MGVGNAWRQEARQIGLELAALRGSVARHGKATFHRWRPRIARTDFALSAYNFAHYLAFRRHDLAALQRRLMVLGLSSLGRSESRVLASLDAVGAALAAMAGDAAPAPAHMPSQRQFFRGESRLQANTEALFGAPAEGRSGHILVTLGTDAADDPAVIGQMAERGADAVRINCAHDDPDRWLKMIANVRAAETRTGQRMRILMDIAGPKVRTADVASPPDRSRLHIGDDIILCRAPGTGADGSAFRTGCTLPQVFDRLKVGDHVSIDDGKMRGKIVQQTDDGFVARIDEGQIKGIKLKPEKGLNFPGVDLDIDSLTTQDKSDLDFIVQHADMIGYSFVETADDVAMLQDEIAARRADWQHLGIVAKIETPRAVRNLPEIIVQAAGRQPLAVMIARGDLSVELGFERVAEMQEEILWLCEAAHVPAIWATQVLEGLVSKGLATRGEMTDAAMAARAECVMLNKGPNIGAGIAALDRLLRRMGEHQAKKTPTLRALRSWAD